MWFYDLCCITVTGTQLPLFFLENYPPSTNIFSWKAISAFYIYRMHWGNRRQRSNMKKKRIGVLVVRRKRKWGRLQGGCFTPLKPLELYVGEVKLGGLCCRQFFMVKCLYKNPQIQVIKERDHYWLATLLDPKYNGKKANLLPPTQVELIMHHFEKVQPSCYISWGCQNPF